MINRQILEKQADEFRNSLGLNNESLNLKSLLNKLDVLTVFKPLGSGFSGMAIKVGIEKDPKRFILINSNTTIGKQNFTICHELYHLYIQENFVSMVCNAGEFNKKNKVEYSADFFSSYFLLPKSGLLSLIPDVELIGKRITLKTILKIEQYFSCSRNALLIRLKDLELISKVQFDEFNQNVIRGALEHGYDISLYKEGNQSQTYGDYGTLARELFEKGKISESHYFSLLLDLGIDINQLEYSNG